MKTYYLNLTFADGTGVVAKAQAPSLDEEVDFEWSGATDRLGQVVLGKHSVGFLQWYLKARAQQLEAEFRFTQDGAAANTPAIGQTL